MVYVASAQSVHCRVKAATDNREAEEWGCVLVQVCSQKQAADQFGLGAAACQPLGQSVMDRGRVSDGLVLRGLRLR